MTNNFFVLLIVAITAASSSKSQCPPKENLKLYLDSALIALENDTTKAGFAKFMKAYDSAISCMPHYKGLLDSATEICIIGKRDSTTFTINDENFIKTYDSILFTKCLKLESSSNLLTGTYWDKEFRILKRKRNEYGILILKDGTKIPIRVSVYGHCFTTLAIGFDEVTYRISEDKWKEWDSFIWVKESVE